MRELIELRENKRFFDNETGPLLRSFFPKSRLLIYCDGTLLGRESTDEKAEREAVKPSAVLSVNYSDDLASIHFFYNGKSTGISCPPEKNAVKRSLYSVVSDLTGRSLPWGSTTGIRPTKEALVMTEQGKSDEEIRDFYREKYFASEEKINESIEIARAEKQILSHFPNTVSFEGHSDYNLQTNGYSLYLGVLFCPSICLYCSFSSHQIDAYSSLVPGYIAALKREIDFVSERFKNRRLDCIYFGGGTPTTLSAAELDDIFSYIEKKLDLTHLAEYTVEAGRPDSITAEKLRVMKAHGITRISVNPQTMNQKTLDLIGRRHTVSDILTAYELARSFDFSCINMDMILGLPGENVGDIRHTLSELKRLSPDNLTVHSLAIKTAARLRLEWDKYEDLDFTNSVAIMNEALMTGREMGMHPYYLYRQKNMAGALENVGMAKTGYDGIYNVMIMEERENIVALGAGAASKKVRSDGAGGIRISRCENVKDIKNYIDRVDEMIERKNLLFSDL
ncbi:MAG: coproporphyrinogen dehydrogenase HemZ [Candidatus Weimeria sp.]